MPLDTLIEEISKNALQRLAGWVIDKLFYPVGWVFLRAVTFGRYPPVRGVRHNRGAVVVVGLALLVIPLPLLFS